MLKDTLYKIKSSSHQDHTIHAALEINKNSEIFIGHFPGQPVLPGACMLEIVKEVLENTLDFSLRITKADQIRFLRLINPAIDNLLQLTITYRQVDNKQLQVAANIATLQNICFKLKGTFIAL
jgi:3-hydroxyacyl-[acyl-carrier-protein] dehydratase